MEDQNTLEIEKIIKSSDKIIEELINHTNNIFKKKNFRKEFIRLFQPSILTIKDILKFKKNFPQLMREKKYEEALDLINELEDLGKNNSSDIRIKEINQANLYSFRIRVKALRDVTTQSAHVMDFENIKKVADFY